MREKIFLLGFFLVQYTISEEIFCNINGKKVLHKVSDKFLSVSIDPAVLLTGVNLSDSSLLLAKHLSPAFIRIAGPSTKYVRYIDNERRIGNYENAKSNVIVTPSMWFGINEWLNLANLTPIFAINNEDSSPWNPKPVLPLLDISDKLNVSCYWQLGYDCSNKSPAQYKEDIKVFRDTLHRYSQHNSTWKIVGNDISKCSNSQTHLHDDGGVMDSVAAVMWEPESVTEENFPDANGVKELSNLGSLATNIWTTAPKASKSVSFFSALSWAKKVGEAAKWGYEVVFRQPRLREMSASTPVYWFSVLHKKLMGRNVLDAKVTSSSETTVYASCANKQNSFVRRGALTVLVVNPTSEKCTASIKLGLISTNTKTMEVQSYVLTSTTELSTDTFLNGEPLFEDLLNEEDPFKPKIRRAKVSKYISLELSPKSIGFFVIPDARIPVCVREEQETELVLEEIELDQKSPSLDVETVHLSERGSFSIKDIEALEKLKQKMLDELESDEVYHTKNYNQKIGSFNSDLPENVEKTNNNENARVQSARQIFIDRAKLADRKKKITDAEQKKESIRQLLKGRIKLDDIPTLPKVKKTTKESSVEEFHPGKTLKREDLRELFREKSKLVDTKFSKLIKEQPKKKIKLSSGEIETVLKSRAKSKANEKHVAFTSKELDALFERTYKRNPIKKRDINQLMLQRYLDFDDENSLNKEVTTRFKETRVSPQNNIRLRRPRDLSQKLFDLKSRIHDKRNDLLTRSKQKVNLIKNRHLIRGRIKRDINMDLLKKRSEGLTIKKFKDQPKNPLKTHLINREKNKATIEQPGQSSEELFKESEEWEKAKQLKKLMPSEISAELVNWPTTEQDEYDDNEDEVSASEKPKMNKKFNTFNSRKSKVDSNDHPTHTRSKKKKIVEMPSSDEALQYLRASQEMEDVEDDLPCIHEFFGVDLESRTNKKNNNKGSMRREMWEDNYREDQLSASSEEIGGFGKLRRKRDLDTLRKEYEDFKMKLQEKMEEIKKQMEENLQKIQHPDLNIPLPLSNRIKESSSEDPVKGQLVKQIQTLKRLSNKSKQKLDTLVVENEKLRKSLLEKTKMLKVTENTTDLSQNRPKNDPETTHKPRSLHYPIKSVTTSSTTPTPTKQILTKHLSKRSAFSPFDLFGNYQPVTPLLKAWKPSDLLSLNKINLLSPLQLNSANEYNNMILKNALTPNPYLNILRRKRRHIEGNPMDTLTNELDDFVNKIAKNTKFVQPKIDHEKGDYKLILPNSDKFELKQNHGNTKAEYVHYANKNTVTSTTSSKPKVTYSEYETTQPITTFTEETDIEKGDLFDQETSTNIVNATESSALEDVPKKSQKILNQVITNITDFFGDMTKKVASYWKHIIH